MSAINHLTLRSTLVYTTPGTLPPPGAFMTTDANGRQVATNNVIVNTGTYSTLTGSTITTSSIVTPAIVGTVTLGQNATYPNRFLELGTDAANTTYIDFHSSDAALPDYSTRIQSVGGATNGTGNLNMYGSTIGLMGTAGVGIGKTNPSYALDVAGTVNISGSYYVNGAPMSASQWTTSGSIIYYNTGNVGVGVTSASALLHVRGTNTSDGILSNRYYLFGVGDNMDTSGTGDNAWGPWYGLGLSTGGLPCLAGFSGVQLQTAYGGMIITQAGNVGFRTTSPDGDFHLLLSGAVNTGWGQLKIKTTSFWGDGVTGSRSETAGTQYATIFPIMFLNPHIVSDTDGVCRIRIGRAGGLQSGGWWETATLANSYFRIGYQGADTGLFLNTSGYLGVGTTSPICTLDAKGIANIRGATAFAVPNGYMAAGSLTIGDTTSNFGGGSNWSGNTAGLMLECLNNTEIAIHDAGDRVVSHSYYGGNRIYMGRDMGWGATPVSFKGRVSIGSEADTTAYLAIYNPNGTITHFGYSNNWNYIRGAYLQIDCNTNVAGSIAASAGVYTSDWFRVNGTGGVHWENYGRGIQSVDGVGASYGCVSTYGAGINSWGGYDIYGRYTFMANGDTVGIHDRNNSWVLYGVNSQVYIPHTLTVQGKCKLTNGGSWSNVPLEITASATFGTGYVGDLGIYMYMYSGNGDQWAIGGNRQWNSNMYFLGNTYTWNALEVCGYIEQDSAGTYRMNFTGQHRSAYDGTINGTTCEGLIVQSTGEYWSLLTDFDNTSMVDHITIDESLPVISLTNTIESPSVFGVISYTEDPQNTRHHSLGRFVSVYQNPAGEKNRVFVNSLGEGAVWVCNYNGSLTNGDYITTCPVPGYGMKQSTNHLMNYTLGKITTDCDFHPSQRPVRQIKKKPGIITRPIMVDKVMEDYNETTEWDEVKQKYIKKKVLVNTTTLQVQAEEEVDVYDENDVLIGKETIKKTEKVSGMVNDLDSAGNVQWIDAVDANGVVITKPAYQTRYLRPDGTIITKSEYDQACANGDTVYIAAFVGCTYHSG